MLDKDFNKDFNMLLEFVEKKENFAFVRFSDGEADILKNIKLILTNEYVIEGEKKHNFGYSEEDHKHFDPKKHGFVREKLIKSFLFSKERYYIGIACPCCIGGPNAHLSMKQQTKKTNDTLTWANLLVNGNYPAFIQSFVPALQKRKIVMICSENANIEMLDFNIVKDFRVGKNCIVNDHGLIKQIKDWIEESGNIKDYVFLFSASSLSEILIYELYKEYDNNTYIDIGTTLHPLMGLKSERDYLKAYWEGQELEDLTKKCVWSNQIWIVPSEKKYWEFIRNLRNHGEVKKNFIQQKQITREEHLNFMEKYGKKYWVCLIDNIPVGFMGLIKDDIRIAVDPQFQGKGIGKFMINSLMKKYPTAFAKVRVTNESSIKLFESCGFKKKYYILEK